MSLSHLEKIIDEASCIKLFRSFVFKKINSSNNDLNDVFDEAFDIQVVKGIASDEDVYLFHRIELLFSHSECDFKTGARPNTLSFKRDARCKNDLLLEHALSHTDSPPVNITVELPTNLDSEEFILQYNQYVLQQESCMMLEYPKPSNSTKATLFYAYFIPMLEAYGACGLSYTDEKYTN